MVCNSESPSCLRYFQLYSRVQNQFQAGFHSLRCSDSRRNHFTWDHQHMHNFLLHKLQDIFHSRIHAHSTSQSTLQEHLCYFLYSCFLFLNYQLLLARLAPFGKHHHYALRRLLNYRLLEPIILTWAQECRTGAVWAASCPRLSQALLNQAPLHRGTSHWPPPGMVLV